MRGAFGGGRVREQSSALHARPRVRLRPLLPGDAERFAAWARDVEVRRCYLGTQAVTARPPDPREWVPGLARWPAAPGAGLDGGADGHRPAAGLRRDVIARAIETLQGQPLGWIELRDANWRRRSGELRVCLGDPATWGQGYGTEAIGQFLTLAFGRWRLHSVHLRVATWNVRAVRAYERCGFRRVGLLRAGRHARDGLEDLWLMLAQAATWRRGGEAWHRRAAAGS